MQPIRDRIPVVLLTLLTVLSLTCTLAASDAVIKGKVTDVEGKPIRGALVKATVGDKSVTRFTQADGRYDIMLPTGNYQVSVEAYGFGAKRQYKDTTQTGETNFSLSPRWDLTRLSSSELGQLLPDTLDAKMVKATCQGCHSFGTVLNRRGSTAAEWASFLPTMTRGRFADLQFSPEYLATMSKALEKYFGPDAPYFSPDADPPKPGQVKHAELSDVALQATIHEYTTPTANTMPHSITLAPNGVAWFSEYDYPSNKLANFNPETEKIEEYPVPVPKALPHTGVVSKDGKFFYVPAAEVGIPAKLFALEIATGKIKTYEWPGKEAAGHSAVLDPTGNFVWISTTTNDELWSFYIKKERFKAYKFPAATYYPAESMGTEAYSTNIPGMPAMPAYAGSYDVTVDSKGIVWWSQIAMGTLNRLDPVTGQLKTYKTPGMIGVRGVTFDAQDNIWFCDFYGHQLGKLDRETDKIKLYHPPTIGAGPYGATVDRQTGDVWFADMNGNNIDRFDPKTEQFVEFPIPTRNSYSRFIAVNSKGRVFFTEFWNGKVGVIDVGGNAKQVASTR